MSTEKYSAIAREVGPLAAAMCYGIDKILDPKPEPFHTHVCPHCTQSRDCNCATEPDTVWSPCEDCLGVPNV